MRGGRESNLIPLFVLLEFILPLSGAGSKVVTPERRGVGRWEGCDGVVLAHSGTAESPRAGSSPLASGGIREELYPHSKTLTLSSTPKPRRSCWTKCVGQT